MNPTPKLGRALAGVASLGAAALTLTAGPDLSGAQAPESPRRDVETETYSYQTPLPYDAGGNDAAASIYSDVGEGNMNYRASFQAYGEVLHIEDNWSDGHEAIVHVNYEASDGTHYYDNFSCGSSCSEQLGSSNNLAEGNTIRIELCMAPVTSSESPRDHICTGFATGVT